VTCPTYDPKNPDAAKTLAGTGASTSTRATDTGPQTQRKQPLHLYQYRGGPQAFQFSASRGITIPRWQQWQADVVKSWNTLGIQVSVVVVDTVTFQGTAHVRQFRRGAGRTRYLAPKCRP